MMKRSIVAVVLIAIMVAWSPQAAAQICQVSGGNAVTITAGTSAAVTPAYDPNAAGDTIFTFSVTITNPHPSRTCDFSLSFTRATLPATMSNGTSTLQYSIEFDRRGHAAADDWLRLSCLPAPRQSYR